MSEITLKSPVSILQETKLNKNIFTVAGGKGGTGKSIIAANLGIGLAILGKRVILVDGDLGGPDLHNYLNLRRPQFTLNDFFMNRVNSLEEIILDTPMPDLKVISGGTTLLGVDNIPAMESSSATRNQMLNTMLSIF